MCAGRIVLVTMTISAAVARRAGSWIEARSARLVARPAFWAILVGALASWPLVWSLGATLPPPLPVLATLPPFRLVDEQGRPFGSQELRGQVWAASFIFTRCATICPAITRKMELVQARTRQLQPAFHLVSITVDPEYDTPERLRTYARSHRALPGAWTFLGGPPDAVKAVVTGSLYAAMGRELGPGGEPGEIFHGTQVVLVDAQGRLRGSYDTDGDDGIAQLVRDAALLVNRGR